MKTSAKRLISLCLALVLVVGLLVMPGAAATKENVKHYDTYTVLGDSIPAGYGLPDYPVPEPNILDGSRVEGSYPDLLAKAVKAKTFYPMTHCGNRAVDLDWLLNEDAKGDDLTIPFLASSYAIDISDGAGGVSMEKLQAEWPKFEKMRTDTIAAVQEADLITLEIGNNDTLTYGLLMYSIEAAMKAAAEAGQEPSQMEVNAEKVRAKLREYIMGLENGEDILKQFDDLKKTSTLASGTLDFLLGSMKYALQGMAQFKEYFDKDIARIRELNPDATIVVVGMYNPFNEVTLTKDSTLPVGRLGAMLIAPLNLFMQYQSSQRSEYIYVDVRDPQVHDFPAILSENGISDFIGGLKHGTHPDEVGHAFITDKIIAALPAEAAPTPTPTATPDPTPTPTAAPSVPAENQYKNCVDSPVTLSFRSDKDATYSIVSGDSDALSFKLVSKSSVVGGETSGFAYDYELSASKAGTYVIGIQSSVSDEVTYYKLTVVEHRWGLWRITKIATANEDGERTRVCRNDSSHVQTEVIPALNPKPSPSVSPSPTAEPTPTAAPTPTPTAEPTPTPTVAPTPTPTVEPTPTPTASPAPTRVFPFKDVAQGAWYYPNVYYVWENDIMEGIAPDTFAPDMTTSRAQFATVIYRMAGKPPVTDAQRAACPFKDLKADWYRDAVVWCYANGVVNGTSDTTFTPDINITREQMVAMLYRYSKDTAVNPMVLMQFSDYLTISDYAIPAVIWAVENNIINGVGDGLLAPRGDSTRAQLAAVLSRYMAKK